MNDLINVPGGAWTSPFDAVRRVRSDGSEYWSARDLMPLLGYRTWQRFEAAIDKASIACRNSGQDIALQFLAAPLKTTLQGGRPLHDFELSRFACYLVSMNGDPRKPKIAAAQTYFAVQTRRAELADARKPILQPYTFRAQHTAKILSRLPRGHWCIFSESAWLLIVLEKVLVPAGLRMEIDDLCDGSVGLCWSHFRQGKPWTAPTADFPYTFPPPSQRGTVNPKAYSVSELPHFHNWLREEYVPVKFVEYLKKKYTVAGLERALPFLQRECPEALTNYQGRIGHDA